jgi:hypothetical protein
MEGLVCQMNCIKWKHLGKKMMKITTQKIPLVLQAYIRPKFETAA